MKKYVFDLDQTLYTLNDISQLDNLNTLYKSFKPNQFLKDLLKSIPYPKYILTNANTSHAVQVLKKLDLLSSFDDILTADHFTNLKPHPEPYNTAIEKFNLTNTENIIFFEDNIFNLETAKNYYNWTTVLIHPSTQLINKPEFIDFNFSNVENAIIFFKIKEQYC